MDSLRNQTPVPPGSLLCFSSESPPTSSARTDTPQKPLARCSPAPLGPIPVGNGSFRPPLVPIPALRERLESFLSISPKRQRPIGNGPALRSGTRHASISEARPTRIPTWTQDAPLASSPYSLSLFRVNYCTSRPVLRLLPGVRVWELVKISARDTNRAGL